MVAVATLVSFAALAYLVRSGLLHGQGCVLPAAHSHPLALSAAGAQPLLPHNSTATCTPLAFHESDNLNACADAYTHPFSGCLSPAAERDMLHQLLDPAIAQPLPVHCGFLDAASRQWLADLHRHTSACTDVVFTVSFSYGIGELASSERVKAAPPGFCFIAFVDTAVFHALQGAPGYSAAATTTVARDSDGAAASGGAPRFWLWELVVTESSLFSNSTARSAHLMKVRC